MKESAVKYLIEKILTEVDKYNEDGDVIGIELWNAYKSCVDLSEFVKQAKEIERNQKLEKQLFIGKVSEIIGFDKTVELLKESKQQIDKL